MPEAYRITSIRKRPDIDESGRFIEVYEVSFVSAKGGSSSVRIPVSQFSPEEARKRVAEEAGNLDALL